MEIKSKCMRNSNVELLRIVAILFVIMGHMLYQGIGMPSEEYIKTPNAILNCMFMGGARIAVNIFICITMWYTVDAELSIKKNVKKAALLWIEMLLIPGG